MRTKIAVLGVAWLLTGLCLADGASTGIKSDLESVALPELGAWAAQRVTSVADADQRTSLARETISAVAERYPTATVLVIGSLARADATLAPVVVGEGVDRQPTKVFQFVAAAVESAPTQVQAIVAVASQKAPKLYRGIGLLAARLAKGTDEKVLAGLSDGLPNLKNLLSKAQKETASPNQSIYVSDVLARVDAWLASAAKSMKATPAALLAQGDSRLVTYSPPPAPPVPGPPFQPLGTPFEEYAAGGGSVPPGGRDYAKP